MDPLTIALLIYLGIFRRNTLALPELTPSKHLLLYHYIYLHDVLPTSEIFSFGWHGLALVHVASHWLLLEMCPSLNESYHRRFKL